MSAQEIEPPLIDPAPEVVTSDPLDQFVWGSDFPERHIASALSSLSIRQYKDFAAITERQLENLFDETSMAGIRKVLSSREVELSQAPYLRIVE